MEDDSSFKHQDKSNGLPSDFVSTRLLNAREKKPERIKTRVGRRESQPHSSAIMYLTDVLTSNFPRDTVLWDLHHYFELTGYKTIDIQFDISYFYGFKIEYELTSYRASRYGGRVPDLAINILSKSTYYFDVGVHVDQCRLLKIPLYVIFSPYNVASSIYKPPFLRAYLLTDDGNYKIKEVHDVSVDDNGSVLVDNVLDVTRLVPFKIGLLKRSTVHESGEPLYYLALFDAKTMTIYPTRAEKEKARVEKGKSPAEKEKARAENEKARAENEKARADKLESLIEKYKNRFGEI
ncbi:MAG: PDDEXK family nuclease [Candidatus Helarchaeales archaeon]